MQVEKQVDSYLAQHRDRDLQDYLHVVPTEHIARCINHFIHGKKKIFRMLPRLTKQLVVWDLNLYSRRYVISNMTNNDIRELIDGMDSDDASDIVYLLPYKRRRTLLRALPKRESQDIEEILTYPEHTAGHIMQKESITVPEYFSVLDCIKRVQRLYKDVHQISFIFVVDMKGIFLGYVPVEKLVVSSSTTKVKDLMLGHIAIPSNMDQEDVAHLFKQADLPVLPVVDMKGKVVGRITADDVVDILEEEQSEDMYRMAGIGTDEGVFDPPLLSVKRRIPWLTINMGTAILAAFVVSLFQGTIQRVVILAAYMPIVAGMGGNAATQTITVIVRAIALREVEYHQAWKVLLKEFVIGAMNGIVLGLVIGIISYLYNGNMLLGIVIGLAMIINLVIAGVSGTVIPLTLRLLGLDPALASSVFVTTCTDVGGFLSFLGLATLLL